MSIEIHSMKADLVECLTKQISEIELLQAMYPDPGTIMLSDTHIAEIQSFLYSKSDYVPNNLDLLFNLSVNDLKLEIFINLPLSYPKEEPDVYIRCNQLNRQQETCLNTGLSEFLKSNYTGEVCLYTAITWLQDNMHNSIATNQDPTIKTPVQSDEAEDMFARYWIYSHHIYNKEKRKEIQNVAKELSLTGFSLIGKPGIICIEGRKGACMKWWKVIKAMCWKKIAIRKVEIFDTLEETNQRKFINFEELHIVMSQFSKYMSDHGFSKIFIDLFGLNE